MSGRHKLHELIFIYASTTICFNVNTRFLYLFTHFWIPLVSHTRTYFFNKKFLEQPGPNWSTYSIDGNHVTPLFNISNGLLFVNIINSVSLF